MPVVAWLNVHIDCGGVDISDIQVFGIHESAEPD